MNFGCGIFILFFVIAALLTGKLGSIIGFLLILLAIILVGIVAIKIFKTEESPNYTITISPGPPQKKWWSSRNRKNRGRRHRF